MRYEIRGRVVDQFSVPDDPLKPKGRRFWFGKRLSFEATSVAVWQPGSLGRGDIS